MRNSVTFTYIMLGCFCLSLGGCSLLFDPDEYVDDKKTDDETDGGDGGKGLKEGDASGDNAKDAKDAGDAGKPKKCSAKSDCGNGSYWICDDGTCLNCDGDKDEFVSDDSLCDDVAPEGEERDCNDTDETVYPNAPAICGDGKINDCRPVQSNTLKKTFGVAEIGNAGAATFVPSGFANAKPYYPIDISAPTQLSVSASVASASDEPNGLLAFVDTDPATATDTSVARLVSFRFKANGEIDKVSPFDLNKVASAKLIRSVVTRRIPDQKISIAAIGRKDGLGTLTGPTLWTIDIDQSAELGSQFQPKAIDIPQTCSTAATTLRPRIALTGSGAHWMQAVAASSALLPVSYTFSTNGITCPATGSEIEKLTTPYIEMTGTAGAFAVGTIDQKAFVWGGASAPAFVPAISGKTGRRALAFLSDKSYLATTGTSSGYEFTVLSCDPASSSAACNAQPTRAVSTEYGYSLSAMDTLGDKGAVFAAIENSLVPKKTNVQNQEAVIRLFDKSGRPLLDTGFQEASSSESKDGLTFPVWRTTYSSPDPQAGDLRIIDLAASAWVDSTGSSKYGFVILVAGIVTHQVAASTTTPEPGEFIAVSGIRGCRNK
jgi:hypothetical protein